MNLLVRFKSLFKDKPQFVGILVGVNENQYTVNLLDGTGYLLVKPNKAYVVGDSVTVQGNTIVGTAKKIETMLNFEV